MSEPDYYDSQASAAGALRIDVEKIREAKRQGCPAFRSGRVYRAPLMAWLHAHRSRGAADNEANDQAFYARAWENRRGTLFDCVDLLQSGIRCGALDRKELRKKAPKVVELIIQLGRIMDAGIDEEGFRITCQRID